MRNKISLIFLLLPLLAIAANTLADELYRWVDEKGTLHFSDNPTSIKIGSQDESQGRKQDRNKDKSSDKNQVRKQDRNQVKNQDGDSDKQTTKEDILAILKRLEVGNRTIPKDMHKYAPAGPVGYERPQETAGATSSTTRRGIS